MADIGLDVSRGRRARRARPRTWRRGSRRGRRRPQVARRRLDGRRLARHDGQRPTCAPAPRSGPARAWCGFSSPGVTADPGAPTEVVGHSLPLGAWSGEVARATSTGSTPSSSGPASGGATSHGHERPRARRRPPPYRSSSTATACSPWPGRRRRRTPCSRRRHAADRAHAPRRRVRSARRAPAGRRSLRAAARRLAADFGCVVLLKGPATVVAEPRGGVLVCRPDGR